MFQLKQILGYWKSIDFSISSNFFQNNTPNESPPSGETVEKAEKLKADANELFKNEKFGAAIELYSQAILLCPSNAVYYANRSIANHRMENFGKFKFQKKEVKFVS